MSERNVQMVGSEPDDGKFLSEEYGVGGPPAAPEDFLPPARTADTVALEIRTLQRQAQGIILSYAIEIGRRLEEAKAMLPHGEWGAWLKRELDYSQSTAQNFMRVFREYGDNQQSLFCGAPKSQTFGNLTYSKALRLLAIPDEEERARFAEENDVEHMTTRELDEALKARNEAEEAAAAAQDEAAKLRQETERLQEQLSDQARVYEAKLSSAGVEADKARAEAQAAREAQEKAAAKAQRLQDTKKQADEKRKAAETALDAAQKELAELKAKEPEVRELTREEKDAMTADAVERARAEGAEQIRDLEKRLAAADPNVAEFKVRYAAWQEEHRKMMEVLGRIAQANEDQAVRLQKAVKAALAQMAKA